MSDVILAVLTTDLRGEIFTFEILAWLIVLQFRLGVGMQPGCLSNAILWLHRDTRTVFTTLELIRDPYTNKDTCFDVNRNRNLSCVHVVFHLVKPAFVTRLNMQSRQVLEDHLPHGLRIRPF